MLTVIVVDEPATTDATRVEALRLKVAGDVDVVEFVIDPNNPWVSFASPAVK
jgi:hypothetical protein